MIQAIELKIRADRKISDGELLTIPLTKLILGGLMCDPSLHEAHIRSVRKNVKGSIKGLITIEFQTDGCIGS
jgi:hypothetical protein